MDPFGELPDPFGELDIFVEVGSLGGLDDLGEFEIFGEPVGDWGLEFDRELDITDVGRVKQDLAAPAFYYGQYHRTLLFPFANSVISHVLEIIH